jgi:hypothetical protein
VIEAQGQYDLAVRLVATVNSREKGAVLMYCYPALCHHMKHADS